MVIRCLGAFLAEIGFGLMFNIHGKKLLAAAITGTVGSLVYELIKIVDSGEIYAMFFAACALCAVSELLARKMKTPVTTFLICALIPLVPGGGMYYTMLAIIQGNTMNALEIGIHTLGCAGALALGIALTSAFCSFSFRKNTIRH